jgi:nucleotide-binding universal stress UspA family protein
VLAATDLSELGNQAVCHAYSVLPEGGVVHLIHVITPESSEETNAASLEALVPADANDRRIETSAKVIVAHDVAAAIRAQAERLGVDLVCVGSHGRTGLTRVLLGSVAEQVLRHTSRPVLIVRYPPS